MKKILVEFLKTFSIRKDDKWRFGKFVEENYPDVDKYEARNFYEKEQKRIAERDKNYETKRVKKTLSFSKDEWKIIEEKMKEFGLKDFSSFAKNIILKKKIKLPIEKEVLFEINKIGNNLNQIAKRANGNEITDVEILTLLVGIETELKNLKK